MSQQSNRGFTLVEVLVVAALLTVFVMVVTTQFAAPTGDATRANAEFQLSNLRAAIQIYRAEHDGLPPALPPGATTIDALVHDGDATGGCQRNGGCGPYLPAMPENPFTQLTTVKSVSTPGSAPAASQVTAGQRGGWLYDPSTGNIWFDSNTRGEFAW